MGKTSIIDIYQKYYGFKSTVPNTPKMDLTSFLLILSIDPTASEPDNDLKGGALLRALFNQSIDLFLASLLFRKGKYMQWLIAHKDEFSISPIPDNDDSALLTRALFWFDYNKSYLPQKDIYAFNPQLLIDFYYDNENLDLRAIHEAEKAEDKGATLAYSDADWAIVIPHTFEASCFYAQFTKWCTTSRDDVSYFYDYRMRGPLFICIDRHAPHKYQFYFAKGEYDFRNEIDNAVYPWDVNLSAGAIRFLKEYSGSRALNTDQLNAMLASGKAPADVFDRVFPVSDGLQLVKIDMRYNFVCVATNQLVGKQWYFYAEPYADGLAKVYIQRFTHAHINVSGQPINDGWVEDFDDDAWTNAEYYKN